MSNRVFKNIIHNNQISFSLLLDDLIQKLLFFSRQDFFPLRLKIKEQIAIILALPPSTFFDLPTTLVFRPQENSAAGQAPEGQGGGGAGLLQPGQHLHITAGL